MSMCDLCSEETGYFKECNPSDCEKQNKKLRETIIYATTKDENGKYYKIKMKVIEVTEITETEYNELKK